MLKRKRKADEAFDSEYEYVYGIVPTVEICFSMISLIYALRMHSLNFYAISSRLVISSCITPRSSEYRISLTEDALDDDTELCKNVKRIVEVFMGLLKDRVSASDEPAFKKRRAEEKIKKKYRYTDIRGVSIENLLFLLFLCIYFLYLFQCITDKT